MHICRSPASAVPDMSAIALPVSKPMSLKRGFNWYITPSTEAMLSPYAVPIFQKFPLRTDIAIVQ